MFGSSDAPHLLITAHVHSNVSCSDHEVQGVDNISCGGELPGSAGDSRGALDGELSVIFPTVMNTNRL